RGSWTRRTTLSSIRDVVPCVVDPDARRRVMAGPDCDFNAYREQRPVGPGPVIDEAADHGGSVATRERTGVTGVVRADSLASGGTQPGPPGVHLLRLWRHVDTGLSGRAMLLDCSQGQQRCALGQSHTRDARNVHALVATIAPQSTE